jgi:hypothetical protein
LSGGLFDARGCLSEEGLAALRRAPVGQAPAELAAHLASCARCQDRLLVGERLEATEKKARPAPWRNVTLVLLALLMTLVALGVTLAVLGGR